MSKPELKALNRQGAPRSVFDNIRRGTEKDAKETFRFRFKPGIPLFFVFFVVKKQDASRPCLSQSRPRSPGSVSPARIIF